MFRSSYSNISAVQQKRVYIQGYPLIRNPDLAMKSAAVLNESPIRRSLAKFVATLRAQAIRALELHLQTCQIIAEAHQRRADR